jgi:hypothetical protein
LWTFNKKIDRNEQDLAEEQYLRMLELLRYYGISGNHEYPTAVGVAPAPGLAWYHLSVALASELDPSLTIVDAPTRPRTARRWRGLDGEVLVTLVETIKENRPGRSIRWCLREIQKYNGGLARYPLDQLYARYQEAKHRFRSTKLGRK